MPTDAPLTIQRILAPNPGLMTGPGTNTFVVGDAGGRVVIDPGCDDADHLRVLAAAGNIQAIVVTHGHPDHLGGAGELAALLGVPLLALDRGPHGVPAATATLRDGDRVPAGRQTLLVVATPGHRFDHLCLWHAPSGTLFAGDLLTGFGTVVIAPPEGDLRAYLASLERVRALGPRHLWPAHGERIDDPESRLAALISHRREREALVVAALRSGPATLDALVPVVYADTPPALHGWAARSLLAHLLKLETEGRATRPAPPADAGPWQAQDANTD